jgi:dGTPase
MRTSLEEDEDRRLAPGAVRSAGQRRRHPGEDARTADYRTAFQHDRDRIVYSRAFRRLRQKAQTGPLPAYEDHRRNRLTHTLEVAQLARTLGRGLALNEDLIEAVALAHDLGTPPFGPAGEAALDDALSGRLDGRGGPGLGDLGGFRRTWQSLRVVDRLEKRYSHPGLNLTDAVREGVLKAGARTWDVPADEDGGGLRAGAAPHLEAQVVAVADRIATALSDLDDALQSGEVDVAQVERLGAVAALRKKLGSAYPPRAGRFMKANAIHRGLTHLLVTGTLVHSARRLDTRAGDGEGFRGDEIGLAPQAVRLLEGLEAFLDRRVHRGYRADRVDARGRRVLLGLLAAYHRDPSLLEDHVLLRVKEATGRAFLRDVPRAARSGEIAGMAADPRFVRVVADHLAAMTDPYALAEHRRLAEAGAVPVPSVEQLRREEDA